MSKIKILKFLFILVLIFIVLRFFEISFIKASNSYSHIKLINSAKELQINFSQEVSNLPPLLKKIEPYINGQTSSVSVVDINNDGFQDIYFAGAFSKNTNKLFENQNGQYFVDKTDKYRLITKKNNFDINRSLFFDCDNDGDIDVVHQTDKCLQLQVYDFQSNFYEKAVPLEKQNNLCSLSIAAQVIDLDNNGYLDLISSELWQNNLNSKLPENIVNSSNGGETSIFLNKGNCNFQKTNIIQREKKFFSNAIGAGYLTNSEKLSIWFANDFNKDEVFEKSNGQFINVSHKLDKVMAKSGMSAELIQLPNSNSSPMFVSQVYEKGFYPHGNSTFEPLINSYKNIAPSLGLDHCGWAWGAKFIDLDNDSYVEGYVANGYYSNKGKTESSFFSYMTINNSMNMFSTDIAYWPDLSKKSLAGQQQDCLFVFDPKTKVFKDINLDGHLDKERKDGRAVASLDFNNDGLIDLVVSNYSSEPYFFINKTKTSNLWIGFDLRKQDKISQVWGAQITVKLKLGNGTVHVLNKQNFPFNGYASQSDARLHFGLSHETEIIEIKVQWPNGVIEKIDQFRLSTYNNIIWKQGL